MTLREIQTLFVRKLDPFQTGSQVQAEALINESEQLGASEKLAIYRRNISAAHIEALAHVFPVCTTILGRRCLATLGREYCWRIASGNADLNIYGEQFPGFIRDCLAHNRLPKDYAYLTDLAQLEYLVHIAHYAKHPRPFDFATFRRVSQSPQHIRFELSPGLSLLTTIRPLQLLRSQHSAGALGASVEFPGTTSYLCIHRLHRFQTRPTVVVESISANQYRLLRLVERSYTLSQLADDPLTGHNLDELIRLIQRGWISGLSVVRNRM